MPFIKICGIANIKDAVAAADNGVDLIGIICDPQSPRYVSPQNFLKIHSAIPARIKRVGVFNHPYSPEWSRLGDDILSCFDRIQYGHDNIWQNIIGRNIDSRRKIRSFALQGTADLLAIAAYGYPSSSYLVNVHVQNGASRDTADEFGWHLARQVHQFGKRLYLAGGLEPSNVAKAISHVLPYAVDVNVGVEKSPGCKDHAKIRDFVQAVRCNSERIGKQE
jgi:phosphoribosylanthranilate isomerase